MAFNRRVLAESMNPRHPLLERLRFLAISANNLDEFYMVRVAGLKAQVREGVRVLSQDGLTPGEQLVRVNAGAADLMADQQTRWRELCDELAVEGLKYITTSEVTAAERTQLEARFLSELFPLLTPMAIDPAHPFPFIPNLAFSLVLKVRRKSDGRRLYALTPLPAQVARFWDLAPPKGSRRKAVRRVISLESMVMLFLDHLFPGCELEAQGVFRLIRDSDVEMEEEAEDLVREFEAALKQRRLGSVVRVEIESAMPEELREFISQALHAKPEDIVLIQGLLGLDELTQLIPADRAELKFKPFEARFPERIRDHGGDCFAAIREKDILVHHPFESFDVVVQFLLQAARDPNVLAIKQTLYRTSKDSPIVGALIEAAENGKNVTAVIEIKARFDEEANLKWARDLERSGVHVVYGFIEYKTHAKLLLVTRRESTRRGKLVLRRYAHLSTGNYNPGTARLYTDVGMLTADELLTADADAVFHQLASLTKVRTPRHLLTAPFALHRRLVAHIGQVAEAARAGLPARIVVKINGLTEPMMIEALVLAGQAGADIDLIVRGACMLPPGIAGLTDRIRVRAVVGRFLEHTRVMYFRWGEGEADEALYLSSADWMGRNMFRRIEIAWPVRDAALRQRVIDECLVPYLHDQRDAWLQASDGSYERVAETGVSAQAALASRYMAGA